MPDPIAKIQVRTLATSMPRQAAISLSWLHPRTTMPTFDRSSTRKKTSETTTPKPIRNSR